LDETLDPVFTGTKKEELKGASTGRGRFGKGRWSRGKIPSLPGGHAQPIGEEARQRKKRKGDGWRNSKFGKRGDRKDKFRQIILNEWEADQPRLRTEEKKEGNNCKPQGGIKRKSKRGKGGGGGGGVAKVSKRQKEGQMRGEQLLIQEGRGLD